MNFWCFLYHNWTPTGKKKRESFRYGPYDPIERFRTLHEYICVDCGKVKDKEPDYYF